ncbi:MAG: geranylgeranylglycerol-phosphate geranylgeranyltransferase [Odoribacter sp.]|nr:geranylgeranylglycerol-phosphate geranylgeranyltransferase [Odoribacter sp.]
MSGIFRLIRLRTLAFAIFTLYAMRYFVVRPILAINDFSLQWSDFSFTLLVISVCCLISGAYVINDYFDTKTDRIAGVKEVLVGRHVSRRNAMTLHSVLNVIAIVIAFYLSMTAGIWKIGVLFLLVSGLLWFYSSAYKKYFIVGNVLVAGMMALIPLSVLLFEIPVLNREYIDILIYTQTDFMYMFRWVGGFSCFLFVNTLLYEMNKDLYTAEGDRENGIKTLAVGAGIRAARYAIVGIGCVCVAGIWLLYYTVFNGSFPVLLYFSGLSLFYVFYMGLMLSEVRRRKVELGMIRFLTVGGVAFSLLLNQFFRSIF